jgi:hypothetical protein
VANRPKLDRPDHRRYFVVFTQGEPRWYDRFFDQGYAHTYLLIWDEFCWIVLHPTTGITQIHLNGMPEFQHPDEWLGDEEATVIEAELEWDERWRNPWVFAPISCVEVVKSALGIRQFWLWTPRQLEKYLFRRWHSGITQA